MKRAQHTQKVHGIHIQPRKGLQLQHSAKERSCGNHRKVRGCQEKTHSSQQKVHGIHIQPRRRSVVSPNQQAKTKLKNCPTNTSKLKMKIH
jgi:hypothetical protein